ncbi:hypothetical protein [Clostridium sp. DL1XJH146]
MSKSHKIDFKLFRIVAIVIILSFSVLGCAAKEEAIEKNNDNKESIMNSEELNATDELEEAVKEIEDKEEDTLKNSDIVKCGEEYNAGDLSFNIIEAKIENKVLIISMEVFNNSGEDINFSPMDRLTVFNENGEECSWNMMVGKLGGLITPNNKIVGETGFDIADMETDNYVLHIGESFEFKPAIEISSSDIGKAFTEIFEGGDLESEYTIGVPVESEGFDMLITKASVKPSDKEGQEIVLIELSMTNNDTESHALAFEIGGVYTASGTELKAAYNDWTFRNYDIESSETATGIVSYYCDAGNKDFYMVVKPDVNDFSRQEIITFSSK